VKLAANESSFEYLSNSLWYQLISFTAKDKNQIKKIPFFIFFENFTVHIQILIPYLLFTIKSKLIDIISWDLWHWLHLMTLFPYLRKKIPKTHFFHEKYLIEQLFPFFMVRGVVTTLEKSLSHHPSKFIHKRHLYKHNSTAKARE